MLGLLPLVWPMGADHLRARWLGRSGWRLHWQCCGWRGSAGTWEWVDRAHWTVLSRPQTENELGHAANGEGAKVSSTRSPSVMAGGCFCA
jgi:hypothetical protein